MAGYGNRTAPDYTAEDLTDQHDSTRLGLTETNAPYSNAHPTYGSGTTGGAGFGNKRSSVSSSASPSSSPEEFRFDKHHDTAPYSNAHTYGSGSTGGAGYGNKTGSFSAEGKNDSTVGKLMERVGGMVHSKKIVEKGKVMRDGESGLVE